LAVPVPVALIRSIAAALTVSGAAQGVGLSTHQGMDERGQQFPQHVGVSGGGWPATNSGSGVGRIAMVIVVLSSAVAVTACC
jgi:hypothetical protein